MNSEHTFFNYDNPELKVDETFITESHITIKKKKLTLKLLGMIAP